MVFTEAVREGFGFEGLGARFQNPYQQEVDQVFTDIPVQLQNAKTAQERMIVLQAGFNDLIELGARIDEIDSYQRTYQHMTEDLNY